MKLSPSAFLLAAAGLASSNSVEQRTSNKSTLNWAPCALDGLPVASQAIVKNASLLCATHKVPLDWTNERNGRTISLQLIKAKANKEPFKGSVFTQPGGPGGSGVEEIIERGLEYREILGGQWDIIAFDLRGTGRTFPVVCNPVNASSTSLSRRALNFTLPQAEMWRILKERAWRDGGLYAEACAQTQSVADYASYLSTPFAARDMLSIVDALGEDGKLRLWGRSYGTVLAQTFASMFPKRVGRIVADSVVLLSDYYSGLWLNTHRDTEKVILNFFRECIAAGTEMCPVANFTGPASTPESLLTEFGNALGELLQRSIRLPETAIVTGPFWQPGSLYLYDIVKYGMFTASYEPTQFLSLFVWANATLNRDWDTLYQLVSAPPPNGTTDATPQRWNLGQVGAFFGVACSDNEFRASRPEDMYSLVQAQQSAASFLDAFGPQIWPCAQWKFRARETFKGPFHAVNTSYPILMINSPQDPITSLGGAWAASANYLGSRLLVHNGHGHGSINHPSNCTLSAIHDYFNNGTLPEVGKVCQPDRSAYEIAIEYIETLQNQTSPLEKRSIGDGVLRNKFSIPRNLHSSIFNP